MDIKKKKALNICLNVLLVIACVVTIYFVFFSICFFSTFVDGVSMRPTYNVGEEQDRILVSKYASYSYGDVVIVKTDIVDEKTNTNKYIIKRVIACAGDSVNMLFECNKLAIFVNGEQIDESAYVTSEYNAEPLTYINFSLLVAGWQGEKNANGIIIPNDSVFVLGDNRNDSADSSIYGPYNVNRIAGVVLSTIPQKGFPPLELIKFVFKGVFK